MRKELPKVYEPQQVENQIYKMWEENGHFKPNKSKDAKPFTIVMPPPNVTGQLHMGHAMDATLQDTLIRFKRMQGFNALWLPGIHHSGELLMRPDEPGVMISAEKIKDFD